MNLILLTLLMNMNLFITIIHHVLLVGVCGTLDDNKHTWKNGQIQTVLGARGEDYVESWR